MNKYYMGLSDYFGNNDPSKIFEDEMIPLLKKLGIKKDKDIEKIFGIVRKIAEKSYFNGENNIEEEINDY